jgi:hypothetical protein
MSTFSVGSVSDSSSAVAVLFRGWVTARAALTGARLCRYFLMPPHARRRSTGPTAKTLSPRLCTEVDCRPSKLLLRCRKVREEACYKTIRRFAPSISAACCAP